MTIDAGLDCKEISQPADQSLREENLRLRTMLVRAEEVAARYTIMLREGNHRIKNSLQIVSSLMALQAAREASLSTRDALHTAAARIQAIGRMHDALQESEGQDSVNLGALVEVMSASLHEMAGDPLGVTVHIEADQIMAPVETVQSIVLAVNELVVNALRHAFPDGRAGEIHISLRRFDGQLHIIVADNGVGMPDGHVEGRGYGMKLVRMMTEKIGGTICVATGPGARITIVAPESAEQPVAPFQVVSTPEQVSSSPLPDYASVSTQRTRVRLWPRIRWTAEGRG